MKSSVDGRYRMAGRCDPANDWMAAASSYDWAPAFAIRFPTGFWFFVDVSSHFELTKFTSVSASLCLKFILGFLVM